MADLAELQRLFHARVISGAPVEGLIATGDPAIYARMYVSRLQSTLAADHPKLRAALGDAPFADIVARYLRAHPPRSFTLRDAGLALSSFLATAADVPAWAADLAALERARIEVFDGRDAPALTAAEVGALGDGLPDLIVRWVPASAVVSLAWAVDDLWAALEDDQPSFSPVATERVVLAWRRDLALLHRTLDADEAQLAGVIAAGARFADVCELLAERHGVDAGARAVELLVRWLDAAVLAGS